MKKLLLAAGAIALSGLLAGCLTVNNPVTYTQLYEVENAYGIALSIAKAYRSRPLCLKGQTTAANLCAERGIILKMQTADRNIQRVLANIRAFAKNNPTIDVTALLSEATSAIAVLQSIEQLKGVQ